VTTLQPLREDELVAELRRIVEPTETSRIVVGIGDDAAVWQPSRSHRSVVTTDTLVEGVHFARETMAMFDVGWRTTMANLSDLAAMAARPVLATVALAVPPNTNTDDLLDLYRGLADAARCYRLAIVGGDLTRGPVLSVTMTAIGEVRASNVKLRSGARPGDVIAVTGPLGASRAGFDAARGAIALGDAVEEAALLAHRHPLARVVEGRWLGASANVHAMMDCSDGLSTDLSRLCAASGVGTVVESVPVAEAARAAANALGEDDVSYALAGGEEYELIVAVAHRAFAHLARRFQARFNQPLLKIGTLREQPGLVLLRDGAETPLRRTGWDHFAQGNA
jgi:thiamine-monophosphate kinase